MPERISRPPIRLAGELPDGRANGTAAWASHFLHDTDQRWAIVAVRRKELTHDDETGADVAKLRIVLIQPAPGDVESEELSRLARKWLDEAGGQPMLDFDPPTDLARRQRLENEILAYAADRQLDARQVWVNHFGADAPVGPRGAELAHLLEFAGDAGLLDDDSDGAGEDRKYCDESVQIITNTGTTFMACARPPGHDGDHEPMCTDVYWCELLAGHDGPCAPAEACGERIDGGDLTLTCGLPAGHDGDHDPEPDQTDSEAAAAEDDARHAAAMAPAAPAPEWSDG